MAEKQIVLRGISGVIVRLMGRITDITPDAKKSRDELIAKAKEITSVTNFEEQKIALERRNAVKGWLKTAYEAKSTEKRPVDELGKAILTVIETATTPAESVVGYLDGLINHFQKGEIEKRRQAELAAERERKRLEAEAAAAEAERQRLAAELAKAEAQAPEQAAAVQAKIEELEDAEFERSLAQQSIAAPAEPAGKIAKPILYFEVIGFSDRDRHASLVAFAQAYPRMVTIEIKKRDLNEALNNGTITAAPGIKVLEKVKDLR